MREWRLWPAISGNRNRCRANETSLFLSATLPRRSSYPAISELREGRITHGQHAADVRKPWLNRARAHVVALYTVPLLPRVVVRLVGGETAAAGIDALLIARGALLLREFAPLDAVLRVARNFLELPPDRLVLRVEALACVERRPLLPVLPIAAWPPRSSARLRRRVERRLAPGEHARRDFNDHLTQRPPSPVTTHTPPLALPGPRPRAERPGIVRARRGTAILGRHPIDHDVTVTVGAVGVLHDEGLPVTHAERLQALACQRERAGADQAGPAAPKPASPPPVACLRRVHAELPIERLPRI